MKFFSIHKKNKDHSKAVNFANVPDPATLLNKYPTFSAVIKEINNTTAEFIKTRGVETHKEFEKRIDKLDQLALATLLKMFGSKKPSEAMDFFYLKDLKDEIITKSTREFYYNCL